MIDILEIAPERHLLKKLVLLVKKAKMSIFAPAFELGISNCVVMMKQKEFTIPFSGLKQGKHNFEFKIDNRFFESFGFDEFNSAELVLGVVLNKATAMLEFGFKAGGSVNVDCDVSNEPYDQEINAQLELVVKFGEVYNDDDDEILIIPHGSHQVNVAQYVYEMLVLAVPQKRIHPGIADGTLRSKAVDRLAELQPRETSKGENKNDPRWDKLKNLLTDK